MLGRYVTKYRRNRLVQYIAMKCLRYLDRFENADDYSFDNNGEGLVLQRWSRFDFKCVLDVGANVGDWSTLARAAFPNAALHCFEILPATAEKLRNQLGDSAIVNEFGLSDKTGEVKLRYFPEVSTLTTITDYPHEFAAKETTGQVVSGDGYLKEHNINHVDLVKLDVEGAENLVLAGFEETLQRGAIDIIQFEYGKVSILTKFLLRDFYDLLIARGFRIGKIYPDGVEFRDYIFEHEDFRGANFVAIRSERGDLIDAVR